MKRLTPKLQISDKQIKLLEKEIKGYLPVEFKLFIIENAGLSHHERFIRKRDAIWEITRFNSFEEIKQITKENKDKVYNGIYFAIGGKEWHYCLSLESDTFGQVVVMRNFNLDSKADDFIEKLALENFRVLANTFEEFIDCLTKKNVALSRVYKNYYLDLDQFRNTILPKSAFFFVTALYAKYFGQQIAIKEYLSTFSLYELDKVKALENDGIIRVEDGEWMITKLGRILLGKMSKVDRKKIDISKSRGAFEVFYQNIPCYLEVMFFGMIYRKDYQGENIIKCEFSRPKDMYISSFIGFRPLIGYKPVKVNIHHFGLKEKEMYYWVSNRGWVKIIDNPVNLISLISEDGINFIDFLKTDFQMDIKDFPFQEMFKGLGNSNYANNRYWGARLRQWKEDYSLFQLDRFLN